MDKAVEELQQELKLLKNEIKETLTDVREVLLNTVENPFPQEYSGGQAPMPSSPIPSAPAQQQAAPAPQQPSAPVAPQPSGGAAAPSAPSGGGGGIVLGNLGGGGGFAGPAPVPTSIGTVVTPQTTVGPSIAPDQPGPTPPMSAGPGLPPSTKRAPADKKGVQDDGEGAEDDQSAAGPGLPPNARGSREDKGDRRGRTAERQRDRPPGAMGRGGRRDAQGYRSRESRLSYGHPDDLDDEALEDAYEYEDESAHGDERPSKVDMVVVASLAPWLGSSLRQLGRKRVKGLLDVYASMGGMPVALKEVLHQIVDMDDTERAAKPISVHDTMRFLVELDDLMWRGRQDWRRAALLSMIGTGFSFEAE